MSLLSVVDPQKGKKFEKLLMDYRRFGKTNLKLSAFSLGTMRCLASFQVAMSTIDKAISSLGINHLETARGYGKSEEYLGLALQSNSSLSRDNLYITTKLPPTPDCQKMAVWIDESLRRLRVDYIDCLAIHGINTPEHLSWVTSFDGCYKAILQAKNQGKIKHIGFSTHGSLELIKAAINSDLFEFVNLHYYYFWQRNKPAIDLAYEKDMGIFIISPADKGGRLYQPSTTLKELSQPFNPLELTYRWLLSDPRISTLSMGANDASELKEFTLSYNTPLTTTEKAVFSKLEKHLTTTLKNSLCSQCDRCLPCPESINIPEILRLRNLAVGYDMLDYGQYRYPMLENAGHWFAGNKGDRCTDCGDCLPRCPNNLDIPNLLKDTHLLLNGSPRRRLWEN